MAKDLSTTGVECFFDESEIIVSKTNLKGWITYANRVFQRVAGYDERDLVGTPHSIVRHPKMPRCIFKLLWDTIETKKEIFAYVINRAKNGDHYWVFAHVTPSLDGGGNVIGYHSSRRVPDRRVIDDIIAPLYRTLLGEEAKHDDRKIGMAKSHGLLGNLLKEKGMGYDELVFAL